MEVDELRGEMAEEAYRGPAVTIEAIMTWLDLGAAGPSDAARTRIARAVKAVLQSATRPR